MTLSVQPITDMRTMKQTWRPGLAIVGWSPPTLMDLDLPGSRKASGFFFGCRAGVKVEDCQVAVEKVAVATIALNHRVAKMKALKNCPRNCNERAWQCRSSPNQRGQLQLQQTTGSRVHRSLGCVKPCAYLLDCPKPVLILAGPPVRESLKQLFPQRRYPTSAGAPAKANPSPAYVDSPWIPALMTK
jgi:hypothetical protein